MRTINDILSDGRAGATLRLGDCLSVMRDEIPSESVDLVYFDPPFNSGRDLGSFLDSFPYDAGKPMQDWPEEVRAISGCLGSVYRRQVATTQDHRGYAEWLIPRLLEMRRVLKPTGQMYFQCDYNAAHIVRLLMDAVFGCGNLINEIVWRRSHVRNTTVRRFPQVHGLLYRYGASGSEWYNDVQYVPPEAEKAEKAFNKTDEDGRAFRASPLMSRVGSDREAFEWNGFKPPDGLQWLTSKERLDQLEQNDQLYYSSTGRPYRKVYFEDTHGTRISDVWMDIPPINPNSKERTGYAMQKPLVMMDRILRSSCPVGGTVLDPTCGSGTTLVAAARLGMRSVGIDKNMEAIWLSVKRLLNDGACNPNDVEYDKTILEANNG